MGELTVESRFEKGAAKGALKYGHPQSTIGDQVCKTIVIEVNSVDGLVV